MSLYSSNRIRRVVAIVAKVAGSDRITSKDLEVDVVVVGGGIAGLTAMAYLSRDGCNAVLCEKEDKVGGLVSSFEYKGFTFDGGIRAIESSGVVLPMLKQLGIPVEFLPNTVSIGIGKSDEMSVSPIGRVFGILRHPLKDVSPHCGCIGFWPRLNSERFNKSSCANSLRLRF